MDRGAWWATVHRVTKSWTQLKWLTTHTHTHTHNKICCLSEIQIQLNILYFYLQNMTILNMISQLGNSHWYNAENYRFYSVFTIYNIYSFVCEHIACFFFFFQISKTRTKRIWGLCKAEPSTAVTSHCLVCHGTGDSPNSLAELTGYEQQKRKKSMGLVLLCYRGLS